MERAKRKAEKGESVAFAESLCTLLSTRVSREGVPESLLKTPLGENITYQEAILIAQINKALNGDTQAAVFIRDTSGNKPKDGAMFIKAKKFEDF